jgi:hypothetical protein
MSNTKLMQTITAMMHVYLVEDRYKDHFGHAQPKLSMEELRLLAEIA